MDKQPVTVPGQRTVHGVGMDSQTRCAHYHQVLDVIALRHGCCELWYPCHLCHEELADHPARPWPAARGAEPAVLCGVCGHELTAGEYLGVASCPACQAQFNPGCKAHTELYFELPAHL